MFIQILYYFVSIALFLATLMLLFAMLFFRKTGKSVLGKRITKKHPAYNQAAKTTSNLKIVLVGIFAVISGVNVIAYALYLADQNTSNAEILLWLAPLINIIAAVVITIDARRRLPGILSK